MFGIKDLKAMVRALESDVKLQDDRYWKLWHHHDDLCKFLGVYHYQNTESGYARKGDPEQSE